MNPGEATPLASLPRSYYAAAGKIAQLLCDSLGMWEVEPEDLHVFCALTLFRAHRGQGGCRKEFRVTGTADGGPVSKAEG